MSGMETLNYRFTGGATRAAFAPVLVGVVGSGNLEVMIEPGSDASACSVRIETSARGFGTIWEAVLQAFHERHRLAGIAVSINDMGATPAVVGLRLDQAVRSIGAEQTREAAP